MVIMSLKFKSYRYFYIHTWNRLGYHFFNSFMSLNNTSRQKINTYIFFNKISLKRIWSSLASSCLCAHLLVYKVLNKHSPVLITPSHATPLNLQLMNGLKMTKVWRQKCFCTLILISNDTRLLLNKFNRYPLFLAVQNQYAFFWMTERSKMHCFQLSVNKTDRESLNGWFMDITEARLSGGSAVDEAVNILVKILLPFYVPSVLMTTHF